MPFLSSATTDLAGEPASACSTASRCSSSNSAMIPAVPGGSFSPILSCIPRLDPVVDELADDAARRGADRRAASSGGANETHGNADAAAPPHALAAQVVAGLLTVTLPSLACVTRMTPSILTFFALTSPTSASKSLRCRVDVRVAGYEDIRW